MGELLLLTAIAWAAARGIESTINEVKGRSTTKHKAAVAKAASTPAGKGKGPGGKAGAKTPSGVPATFGRKAASLTAKSVAGGATWGRDAVVAYRQSIGGAWQAEAEKARRRRAEKDVAKAAKERAAKDAATKAAAAERAAAEKAAKEAAARTVPPPPPYPPTVGAPAPGPAPVAPGFWPDDDTTPTEPRLRVLPGGVSSDPDPTRNIVTILSAEIGTLRSLTGYLQAVSTVSQINADAAQIIAGQDTKLAGRLDYIAAHLADLDVDAATVAEINHLRNLVEVQATTARQCSEQSVHAAEAALVAAHGAHVRHGDIAAAVAEAEVATPAAAAYYNEGK